MRTIVNALTVASLLGSALFLNPLSAEADVKLHQLISDGMVIQRRLPVRIWGKANPGERVSISLNRRFSVTTATADGSFETLLPPMEAGGPYVLTVQGGDSKALEIKDVMIGEVWVCSGQSNMEWNLGWLPGAKDEIASTNDPQLRMFTVPKAVSGTPQTELMAGAWKPTAPANTGAFSAVGYYFGKHLRKSLKVPIGLIHTSWGGTRIEAWTARDILLKQGTPESEFVASNQNDPNYRALKAKWERDVERWKAAGSPTGSFVDPGIAEKAKGWERPDADTADWKPIKLPSKWEASGIAELDALDGGVWFRREITIPDAAAGKAATITLGAIDDNDQTYVNGVKVGQTGPETASSWMQPRKYTIPAGVLKAGRNVIAVRVWDNQGDGGITGPADAMRLTVDSGTALPLDGEWRFRIEVGRPQDPGGGPDAANPNAAAGLYNAMLKPIVRYPIKGAIWYQGESNAGGYMKYRQQLPDMITNWRKDWGVGDFTFLVVQLASFTSPPAMPGPSGWAGLREAQAMAASTLPNVGYVTITDVGDEKDIHPQRKEPVGERLSLVARQVAYGEKNVVAYGPRYKTMQANGNKATVTFDTASPLAAKTTDSLGKPVSAGAVVGFAAQDDKGTWHWAEGKITGRDTIEVTAPAGVKITQIRFGWADFPIVNLWNATLPAVPFRTDKE